MLNTTVEELKILKSSELGPRGGFFDRTVVVNWNRFLPDGTTMGVGSDGRYYSTDRSVLVNRKTKEITKDVYFAQAG